MDFLFEDRAGIPGDGDPRLPDEVRSFFERYDQGNTSGDTSLLGKTVAETFFFCGPDGQQTVKREDLLKVVPKMLMFYKSIGLLSNRLARVEAKTIDDQYIQVRGTWEMQFEKKDSCPVKVSIHSTYLLFRLDGLRIVSQIDHQDFNQVLRAEKILVD